MHSKDIVIYGAGECARISADFFEWLGIKVLYFCDPHKDNWGKPCRGKKTISPEELVGMGLDVPIFIASEYGLILREQLLAAGFTNLINPRIHQLWTEAKPHVLEVTTSIGCKVNCRFCCQGEIISAYSRKSNQMQMTLDAFKRCLETVPSDVRIHFCGIVEPFLNRQCADMLRYAYAKGHEIWLSSTLVGLSADQLMAISDIPFKYIALHVADGDGHSHIPVTKEYKHILRSFISMVKQTRIKVFHCHGQLHKEITGIVNEAGWPISYEIHDRAGHETDASLQHRRVYGDIYCHHNGTLFRYNMLLPDGRIVLCHCDCTMRYELGNLLENTYESLFDSPLITELREKSKGHDGDILCRVCQDARCASGDNFSVWEVPRWEPFRFFEHRLVY